MRTQPATFNELPSSCIMASWPTNGLVTSWLWNGGMTLLNESSNMMEYVCVDAIEPSWNIFEDFQTGGVPAALKRDARMVLSLSINEANTQMKSIPSLTELVYAKGSRLMHMLRRWLGGCGFQARLRMLTLKAPIWEYHWSWPVECLWSSIRSWLLQPSWILGWSNLVIQFSLVVLKMMSWRFRKTWSVSIEDRNSLMCHSTATGKACQIHRNWKYRNPGYAASAENEGALRLNTQKIQSYLYYRLPRETVRCHSADLVELDNTSKLQIVQERRLLAEAGRTSCRLAPVLINFLRKKSTLLFQLLSQVISALNASFIDEGTEAFEKVSTVWLLNWLVILWIVLALKPKTEKSMRMNCLVAGRFYDDSLQWCRS